MKLFIITLISASIWVLASSPGSAEKQSIQTATFAGGCFWCMQSPYDKLDGVIKTTVGYMGGTIKNPTYEQVTSGTTNHAESVQIVYDPSKITYEKLLKIFWRNINPLTLNQQFADVGTQYRTAIFYHDEAQKKQAEISKKALEKSGKFTTGKIVTQIVPATEFYPAEEYHQQYYKKNPFRYKIYRYKSGRTKYLMDTWDDESP